MRKRDNIIYWIATLWLALGMVSTGIVQILRMEEEVANFTSLGYPLYLMPLIGVLKIAGVAVVLTPRLGVLKEWAYAGFSFAMTGAVYSHITSGHAMDKIFPPLLLLMLTAVSWFFRPANRKVNFNQNILQHEQH